MAVSMLQGSAGFQRKEVQRLCQWLSQDPQPQLVNLSNVLIAGCAPDLSASLQVPITVTLQGDDIFLQQLPDDIGRRPWSRSGGSPNMSKRFWSTATTTPISWRIPRAAARQIPPCPAGDRH